MKRFSLQYSLITLYSTIVLLGIGYGMSANAASMNITNSVPITSSTLYRMVHHTIAEEDYLLVAAGEDGLFIYQVSENGVESTPVSTIDTAGTAMDVVAHGNYVYVADKYSGTLFNRSGHVLIYDISHPTNPTLAFDYSIPFADIEAVELSEDGTTLYVADKLTGLYIVNVTTPTSPVDSGTYPEGSSTVDMAISGTRLFTLQTFDEAQYAAIQVIDVTNSTDIPVLGQGSADYSANEMTLDDNILYLSNGSVGLSIYDYTTPANPTLLGTLATDGSASAFTLTDSGLGLAADASGGVAAISVINTTAPQAIAKNSAEQTQLNAAVDVVSFNDRLFVLSEGIYELSLSFSFAVAGSKKGAEEKIVVTEGENTWCTITVSDGKNGAQAAIADVNGNGVAYEIVTAPVGKTAKPKLRVFNAMSCSLLSKTKLSDSDSAQKYTIGVGNYYTGTSRSEIVAIRAYTKDDQPYAKIQTYFVNATDNSLKKKASFTDKKSYKQFTSEGFTITIKPDKSYPLIIKAKESTNKKSKFKLKKKDDGSYVLKKKEE